jgi:hypothetical protein
MNKKFIVLIILSLLFSNIVLAISVKEAKEKSLILLHIGEQQNSTHYHVPFEMSLTNLTNDLLDLELDNGVVLIPEDSGEQNFIVTKRTLLSLKPNEQKKVNIFAMCIEQEDSAPGIQSSYSIGNYAIKDLRRLSEFIEEHERFEPDAQFLMWRIADGIYNKDQIDGFTIDDEGNVWMVDGQGEVLEEQNSEPEILEFPNPKLMVSGVFEMSFSSSKNVHIAMFNVENVIVKELYKNPTTPIGKTNLNYAFNSYDYDEDIYFVKLVVDGKVLLARTINMRY